MAFPDVPCTCAVSYVVKRQKGFGDRRNPFLFPRMNREKSTTLQSDGTIPIRRAHRQMEPRRLGTQHRPFPPDIAVKWRCVRILVEIVSLAHLRS